MEGGSQSHQRPKTKTGFDTFPESEAHDSVADSGDSDVSWLLDKQHSAGNNQRLEAVDDLSIYSDEADINKYAPKSFHDDFYEQHKGSFIASIDSNKKLNPSRGQDNAIKPTLNGPRHSLTMTSQIKPSPYLGHKRGPKKTLMELADWGAKKEVKVNKPKPFITDPSVLNDESFAPLYGIEQDIIARERRITNDIIYVKNVAFEVSKFEGMVFDDFELEKAKIETERKKLRDFVLSNKESVKSNNNARSRESMIDNEGSYFTNANYTSMNSKIRNNNNSNSNSNNNSIMNMYSNNITTSKSVTAPALPEVFNIGKRSDQNDHTGLKPLYRLVIEEMKADKRLQENNVKSTRENVSDVILDGSKTKKKTLRERQAELRTLRALHFDDIPLIEGVDFKAVSEFSSFSLEQFVISKVIYYLVFVFVTRIYQSAKIFTPTKNSDGSIKSNSNGSDILEGAEEENVESNGLYRCIQRHVNDFGLDYTNINSLFTLQLFRDIIQYDSELFDTLIVMEIAHLTVNRQKSEGERTTVDGATRTKSTPTGGRLSTLSTPDVRPRNNVFFVYSFFFPEKYLLCLSKIMSFETVNEGKLKKVSKDFYKMYLFSRKVVKHVYLYALRNVSDELSCRDEAFYEMLHSSLENNSEFEYPNHVSELAAHPLQPKPSQIFAQSSRMKNKDTAVGISAFNGLMDLFDMTINEVSSRAEQLLKHKIVKRVKSTANHCFTCAMPTECLDLDLFDLYRMAIDNVHALIRPYNDFKVMVVSNTDRRDTQTVVGLFDELMFSSFDSPLHHVIPFDNKPPKALVFDDGNNGVMSKCNFGALKKSVMFNAVSVVDLGTESVNKYVDESGSESESDPKLNHLPAYDEVYKRILTDILIVPAPITIFIGNNDNDGNNGTDEEPLSYWTCALDVKKVFQNATAALVSHHSYVSVRSSSVKTVILAPSVKRTSKYSPEELNMDFNAPLSDDSLDFNYNFPRVTRSIKARGPTRYLVCISDTENSDKATLLAKTFSRACDHIELLHIPLPSERDILHAINSFNSGKGSAPGTRGGSSIPLTSAGGTVTPSSMIHIVSTIVNIVNERMVAISNGSKSVEMNVCFGENDAEMTGMPFPKRFPDARDSSRSAPHTQMYNLDGVSSKGLLNQVVVAKIVDSYIKLKRRDETGSSASDYITSLLVGRLCQFLKSVSGGYDFVLFGSTSAEVSALSIATLRSMLEMKMFSWDALKPNNDTAAERGSSNNINNSNSNNSNNYSNTSNNYSNTSNSTSSYINTASNYNTNSTTSTNNNNNNNVIEGNARFSSILLRAIGEIGLESPPSLIFTS